MRIRRSASRLVGSVSAPALPGFELPPPSPPPTAPESHAGSVAASETSNPALETCELSRSPWDLMAQLHPSDPQEEQLFLETYFAAVAWRTSWLFQPSMPASSIKEEEEEEEEEEDEADMAVDMVDGVIFELRVPARKKNKIKPRTKKVKAEGSDAGGGAPVWACKKNDGKRWFCRRPVSQPDSFCPYHADYKPPSGSSKPRNRAADYAGEGFYYYAGFGPSRSKRHRVSGSSDDTVPEPTPDGQKEEEAPVPPEVEKHIGSTAGEAQGDAANHQAEQPVQVEEPRCDNKVGIAGYDEESSDDHDFVGDIKTKSPLKKRWRKPVKSRSLNSLM
ncbi:unnamed protein product [Alopecurus aequalis]